MVRYNKCVCVRTTRTQIHLDLRISASAPVLRDIRAWRY